jgi:hypothetical protein
MQPEPPATNPNATTTTNTKTTDLSRKHGISAHEHGHTLPADDNAEPGEKSPAGVDQLALDEALARSLQESAERPRPDSRLRGSPPLSSPSPPTAINRVTEYEQASTPPARRRDGPTFEVIKKPRSPGDKRSPIQELPNGRRHFSNL